jgi:oxygen-independent coproporphyrinogen-3 oxidase
MRHRTAPNLVLAEQSRAKSRSTTARSAYIHVPFCAHKCGYCDFTVIAGRDDLIGRFLQALELELESQSEPAELDTLFIGGGTPTHLPADALSQLMELVRKWFRLADGYEFTVEANPSGLDDDKIKVLGDAGVNRVSLGVQSFDAGVLKLLERDHRRCGIHNTIERLRPVVDNISIDLIFGVPGQSLECWRGTLAEAIAMEPRHISTYGLTYEKGTAFWGRLNKGDLARIPEDIEYEMYAEAMETLAAAGYQQYEISNFAQPGYSCRHNEVYWKGLPYLAFGPGAARFVDGVREINHRSVATWLKRVMAGESPVAERERLTPEDRAREAMVIGLRRCAGIDKAHFRQLTGFDVDKLAGSTIETHCHAGLLEDDGSRLRLTRAGRFVADVVFVDLL